MDMRTLIKRLTIIPLLFLSTGAGQAQCTHDEPACHRVVPPFVKFDGVLKRFSGISDGRVVALRFAIYADATGGTALWQEVQNTQLDLQGRYEVVLGATARDGIPTDLFAKGEPRWLGVQPLWPGEVEEPRVLMLGVPYAMEAANAQTLGGLPASAYAKAAVPGTADAISTTESSASGASTAVSSAGTAVVQAPAAPTPSIFPAGPINTVPKFTTGGALQDSQIIDKDGAVTLRNLGNILFADRFPTGVAGAVAACPANGCIIYALAPDVDLNLGSIDPGTKSITIYLGPYTFKVNTITLRKGMKIIGMGASQSYSGTAVCTTAKPCNGTALQSVNGNKPVFVIPQASNNPASNILLSGFRLYGSLGNTSEDGFFLDSSSTINTGMWESTFQDISVSGFAGVGIHIKSRNDNFSAASQWLTFNNVVVIRTPGGGNALRMEGAIFELRFVNCEFDGQGVGDGTNVYIGGLAGGNSGYPIGIVFEGLVSQFAGTAVQIDGGWNLTFYGSHHELVLGGYLVTDTSTVGTRGLRITDSYFAANVGINGGAGYDLNVATTNATGVMFTHNDIFGPPDSVVKSTNLASVVYQDNMYYAPNVPVTSGLTTQLSPATTINVRGVHSIGLNSSPTSIATINSQLGPGEMVTFFSLGGPVTFQAGGNIDLMGMTSLTVTGTITLVRTDLGGLFWKIVSQWSPTLPPAPTPAVAQEIIGAQHESTTRN
jgi:hypothetical protein